MREGNNAQTFQGQRLDEDLELNWLQFKWRNYDPQTGRFVELDPLSEKYLYNSTYAFSENHVTSHVELEGLEKQSINPKEQHHFPWWSPRQSGNHKQVNEIPQLKDQPTVGKTHTSIISSVTPFNYEHAFGDRVKFTTTEGVVTGENGDIATINATNGKSLVPDSKSITVGPIMLEAGTNGSLTIGLGSKNAMATFSVGPGVGLGEYSFGMVHMGPQKNVEGIPTQHRKSAEISVRPGGLSGAAAVVTVLTFINPALGLRLGGALLGASK